MSERVSRASMTMKSNNNATANPSSNRVSNVNKNNDNNKGPTSYSYAIVGNPASQSLDQFDLMVLDSSIFG